MKSVSIAASVPAEYAEAFQSWSVSNLGREATSSDGLRALIADAVCKPRPPLNAHIDAEKVRVREERGETIAQFRAEDNTYKIIGQKLGIAPERVRHHESKYMRSLKMSELRAKT